MPCDSVRTLTVKWGENTDVEALEKALQALGYNTQLHNYSWGTELEYRKNGIVGEYDVQRGEFVHDENMDFNVEDVQEEYGKQTAIGELESAGWEWAWQDEERTELKAWRDQ